MRPSRAVSRSGEGSLPLSILTAASLLAALPARGEDWPQWRGPASLGVSAESGLPEK